MRVVFRLFLVFLHLVSGNMIYEHMYKHTW